MYAQLTRDLFAIAKFLVVVPSIDFLNVLKADRKYHQSILSIFTLPLLLVITSIIINVKFDI